MSKLPCNFLRQKIDSADLLMLREIRESGLHAGFPSPAGDYEQDRINRTHELVTNPDYTFSALELTKTRPFLDTQYSFLSDLIS
jgi:hypothetical protein